uniref:Diacylglycerol kinase accessory domain-containing protein n=1 Tax=Romanomermis culicivorax TaxID=13658 RepID=A0A915HK05_ROMCU
MTSARLAYSEKKVMNNYFGVGLDAKIALDFHNKRELCADKTRSRSKLFMMYGVLAGKELMHKTFKNLDQRIALECDGKLINLPQLQGIVVLNIPSVKKSIPILQWFQLKRNRFPFSYRCKCKQTDSDSSIAPSVKKSIPILFVFYQGGANFWGGGNNGGRQDETSSSSQGHFSARDAAVGSRPTTTSYSLFQSQAVDDGLLEVVAVFGVLHCATSRLIKLHNHRIAQCQKVKITIAGSEPLPVQVDGEAWLQSAGFIQIVHKNRAKVLVSDKC